MNVEYAFLCDYADSGNKLTAVGIGIDSVHVADVPVVHSQMFAVLALRFTLNETQRTKAFEMHQPMGRVTGPIGSSAAYMV